MYSARDKKETCLVIMLVLWTLACFRTLRMRVRVRRLHECTDRCCCHILDVDSTVQQRPNTIRKLDIVIKQSQELLKYLQVCFIFVI